MPGELAPAFALLLLRSRLLPWLSGLSAAWQHSLLSGLVIPRDAHPRFVNLNYIVVMLLAAQTSVACQHGLC